MWRTACWMVMGLLLAQGVMAQHRVPRRRASPRVQRVEQVAMWGLRMGYDAHGQALSMGAGLAFPLGTYVRLLPSGDVFLRSDVDAQLNLDGVLWWHRTYLGGGVAWSNRRLDGRKGWHTGFNLVWGLQAPGRHLRPYVELRRTHMADRWMFRFVAGFRVPLG